MVLLSFIVVNFLCFFGLKLLYIVLDVFFLLGGGGAGGWVLVRLSAKVQ